MLVWLQLSLIRGAKEKAFGRDFEGFLRLFGLSPAHAGLIMSRTYGRSKILAEMQGFFILILTINKIPPTFSESGSYSPKIDPKS